MRSILLIAFFAVFSVAPGLAYQFVQDNLRAVSRDPATDYLLGVAPNALGGLSLASGLFIILADAWRSGSPAGAAIWSAVVALGGLWAWEATQIVLPHGTFDVHDLAWTIPGVGASLLASRLVFGPGWRRAARA